MHWSCAKAVGHCIAAIWAIYRHMIMAPPEESVESQHSYCPTDDKTWCKYHKDKIFNTNIDDQSKCLPFVFPGEYYEFLHNWHHQIT